MKYKNTKLWQGAFNPSKSSSHQNARSRLEVAFTQLRKKARLLAEEIPADVRQLTDHSIRHLDALWEIGDIIAGDGFKLNPTEAFVFGGAVLLHDLANTVAAFPNKLSDLQDSYWADLVHVEYHKRFNRRPTPEECRKPSEDIYSTILLQRLRQAHAKQAENLATIGFYQSKAPDSPPIHLIDDEDLRNELGLLIGRIAHSHHWPVEKVVEEFRDAPGTPTTLPPSWKIDALKIACLLRAADAAHLDRRRAPALSRAVRELPDDSARHWDFQAHLMRPTLEQEQLAYATSSPFKLHERDAWWLCHDTLKLVDLELRNVDEVLRSERRPRLAARSVARIGSPRTLATLVRTSNDWTPLDIRIRITDVAGVIERFGGRSLYGDNPLFPLRELIGNAADAIRARRALDEQFDLGRILVRLGREETTDGWWLEVEDNGIGMSESVLQGPLLDFGSSYWQSELARTEHPGLISSTFEPTGKFGIGFFSVFMLGSRVRVTTRRYDRGQESARVLEVVRGITHRPLLRHASSEIPSERLHGGGTRIRVWLEHPPASRQGLLQRSGFSSKTAPGVQMPMGDLLSRAVGHVAPTLDVNVNVLVEPEDKAPRIVIVANDWETMPFDALVERLDGSSKLTDWYKALSGEIRREGRLIGRITLTEPGMSHAAVTVHGLSTFHGGDAYEGVLLADNPNLSRTEARPLISEREFREFIASLRFDDIDWNDEMWATCRHFAQLMLIAGLVPEKIPFIIMDGGFVLLQEVRERLAALSGDVHIVIEASFTTEWGEDVFTRIDNGDFESYRDKWHQHESLLIVGPYDEAERAFPGVLSEVEEMFSFHVDDNGQEQPATVPALLLLEASQAWGVELSELTRLATLQRDIGIGNLEDGMMSADVLTIKRPPAKASAPDVHGR